MENRCMRCSRILKDPNASFGWRCAEILGIKNILSELGEDVFKSFLNGVLKAKRLFTGSNISLTDKQWKNLYGVFARAELWKGKNSAKEKKARKEGYDVISGSKKKTTDIKKELAEYVKENGILAGLSKKLAKDKKLDDVTNAVLRMHDSSSAHTKNRSILKKAHTALAVGNYLYNRNIDLSGYKGGYINDQNSGAVSKLRLGVTNMKNNGCEVIAAYNALKVLGKPQDIRAIAYSFETDGQMLLGAFGTNPYAVGRYFEKIGYNVKTIEGDDILTKPTPKADAYIVSFWNSDDVTDALHTVAARKTKDGGYELFNNGPDKKINADDNLAKYFVRNGIHPIVLFGIEERVK